MNDLKIVSLEVENLLRISAVQILPHGAPFPVATMKPADQRATLRAIAKIDTPALEEARTKASDERTLVNRDVSQLAALIESLHAHADAVGRVPVSMETVTAKLDAADQLD